MSHADAKLVIENKGEIIETVLGLSIAQIYWMKSYFTQNNLEVPVL